LGREVHPSSHSHVGREDRVIEVKMQQSSADIKNYSDMQN